MHIVIFFCLLINPSGISIQLEISGLGLVLVVAHLILPMSGPNILYAMFIFSDVTGLFLMAFELKIV
jgi:hypothetical protein